MKSAHSIPPLIFAPVFLALAPVADEIAFGPEPGSEIAKKLELQLELQVEEVTITIDGQALPPEALGAFGDQDLIAKLVVAVTEKYVASRDGRPIDLLRTYDEVAFEAEIGAEKSEPDDAQLPNLSGKTVRFRWNEDEQVYDKTYHESEGDLERLKPLSSDMDLRMLLPRKKVAEGDSWEVAGEGLVPLFLPGFQGGEIGGGALEGEAAEFFGMFRDELGGEMERFVQDFRVRCTYAGSREIDGARQAEIRFAYEGGPKLDLAGLIERIAEHKGGAAPDLEIRAELALELEGEGTLVWDAAAGRMHAFDMQSDLGLSLEVEANIEEDGEEHEVSLDASVGGKATWKIQTGSAQ